MALLNAHTTIDSEKSVAEIQRKIVKHGGRRINFEYGESGELKALVFDMEYRGAPVYFRIEPKIDGVYARLSDEKGLPAKLRTREQAYRVAWRIEKVWLEAQFAKIESDLATPVQLLLCYAMNKEGKTFFDALEGNDGPKLLGR